jgi:predicted neutral ceramidase superfamily lipid hydrolase
MKATKKESSISEITKVHARVVQSSDDLTAAEARAYPIRVESGGFPKVGG